MAPIKIEDNIREKMQEREVQPSENAWAKLDAKLGNSGRSGFDRNTWFAIAAVFTGLIILTAVLLNGNDISNTNQLVEEDGSVEIPNTEPENSVEEIIAIPENTMEEIASEVNKPEKYQEEGVPEIQKKEIKKTSLAKAEGTDPTDKVLAINEVEEKAIAENEIKIEAQVNNEDFMQNKVDEVVAEVEKRVKTNSTVTPEEIDDLLKQAQRQISNQRILNSQTKKVDAAALLEDVEFELERSFRDKVFDALGDGYQKIRTAVAERNN